MPLYDYECGRCGSFTALRPMAEYEAPLACPDCGASAPRVMLTAPRLGAMDRPQLAAHATNERSAHAPRRSGHAPGCGCCAGSGAKAKSTPPVKGFSNRRPWMISH
jgi:putative FmdB family regulatory protein